MKKVALKVLVATVVLGAIALVGLVGYVVTDWLASLCVDWGLSEFVCTWFFWEKR